LNKCAQKFFSITNQSNTTVFIILLHYKYYNNFTSKRYNIKLWSHEENFDTATFHSDSNATAYIYNLTMKYLQVLHNFRIIATRYIFHVIKNVSYIIAESYDGISQLRVSIVRFWSLDMRITAFDINKITYVRYKSDWYVWVRSRLLCLYGCDAMWRDN